MKPTASSILSRAFSLVFALGAPVTLLALCTLLAGSVVASMVNIELAKSGSEQDVFMGSMVSPLAALIFQVFAVAMVADCGVYRLAGIPYQFGEGVRRIASRLPILFVHYLMVFGGLTLMSALLVGFPATMGPLGAAIGSIILVVLVGWALCTFFLSTLGVIGEKLGPISCLRRSAELTRGFRVTIFVTLLLSILMSFGLMILIGVLLGGSMAAFDNSLDSSWELLIGLSAVNAITSIFGILLMSVTYFDIRAAKEGHQRQDTSAIFS